MKRIALVLARVGAAVTLLVVLAIITKGGQLTEAAPLLSVTWAASGTINGDPLGGTGDGQMDLATATKCSVYTFAPMPSGFQPIVYGKSCHSVHHPSRALEIGAAKNLFSLSPDGYDIEVTNFYDNGDVITTTGQVRTDPAGDSYTVDISGTYTGPTDAVDLLGGIENLTSLAPGVIRGVSRETIVLSDGSTIGFNRVATYTLLNSAAQLPSDEVLRITVHSVSFDPLTQTLELCTSGTMQLASVGGIEVPFDDSDLAAGQPASSAGSSGPSYAALAGAVAAALALVTAGGWYARRRRLR